MTKVWDRFYTTRVESGGSGLGLSIVRSVAEAHGGSVELRARPSGGLVVRVSLPGRDGAIPDTDFIEGDYASDRARAHA
jgi:signal transduction histidine kinase